MSNTMVINKQENAAMPHFLGIGVVLAFVLPHTSTALLLVNPLLCLFYKLFKQNKVWYKKSLIVVAPILFTFLVNVSQSDVTTKGILSAVVLLMYFFCFPIMGECKLPNIYLYITFSVILLSQLVYILNVPFLVDLLNRLYPISVDRWGIIHMQNTISVETLFRYRSGGLYRNPNDCARSLTMLLATFMILNNNEKIRKRLYFALPCFFAVLLTGSRTGFAISSLILIFFILQDKSISRAWKFSISFAAVIAFIAVIVNGSNQYRGLNVVQGFNNSANYKMVTFAYYLSSENSVFRILFGYLDSSRFNISGANEYVMNQFDSDYGNIVFCYGFVGFFSILLFFYSVFLKLKKEARMYFVLLLWMYSSTIVASFRALFIFLLLLSVIYSNSKSYSKSNLKPAIEGEPQ